MIQALDAAPMSAQYDQLLRRFAKDLVARPDLCPALIDQVTVGAPSDAQVALLTAALDEARMADENGRRQGAAFLEEMRELVAGLDATLASKAALALSSAWSRAGLTPPPSLAFAVIPHDPEAFAATDGVPDLPDALFDNVFKGFKKIGDQSVSAMVAVLDEMTPTLPPKARFAFIRTLAARPEAPCGEAAAALLLGPDASRRDGALAGLALRQQAGNLSQTLLARLILIRSWILDAETVRGVDEIVRAALKSGVQPPSPSAEPKIHRVISSFIDGSGAQNIAMTVQAGDRRSLAVVLLKQGFGVKDAFTLPCKNATEQRKMIEELAEQAKAVDVPADYAVAALAWALADGQNNGITPVPGFLDVVETAGFRDLRPQAADSADIAAAADREGAVSALSTRARGGLIMASEYWPDHHEIVRSWFEASDASDEAIASAMNRPSMSRALWRHLETRRAYWAMIVARTAALLRAAKDAKAQEFVAVAQALAKGRDLKKTPIMHFVHDMSFQAWAGERGAPIPPRAMNASDKPVFTESIAVLAAFGAKEQKALDRLLKTTRVTRPWIEGFLTSICTAPLFISPGDWIVTIVNVIAGEETSDDTLKKILDLIAPAYNHRSALLHRRAPAKDLFPSEPAPFSLWADGYLTAWTVHKTQWPAKALGKACKEQRARLENSADLGINNCDAPTLRDWLIARFEKQK